ncbi:ABC transporter permease [Citricoccus sp. NPDC055426]|uniref:ABC transporter permease n=1 Tax=Citricoccus sp. NPDC055426 TaxID=3155536 RepID=UPI00344693FF
MADIVNLAPTEAAPPVGGPPAGKNAPQRNQSVWRWRLGAVLRKVVHLSLVLVIVTFSVTVLLSRSSNAASQILGPNATAEQIATMKAQLGLDQPVIVQYLTWVGNALQGDLGRSLLNKAPVTQTISNGMEVTFTLIFLSLFMALVIAVPLAAYAARHPGGLLDTLCNAASSFFIAMPSFVLALLLLLVFSVNLGWFPVSGWVPITEDVIASVRSFFLPALAIALTPMATFYRLLRSDMITTLQQDFVLTAKSKGLSTRYILVRHALRPSLTTVVTMLGLSVGMLITGAVLAESIFRLPGLGSSMVNAVTKGDLPVVQGLVLVIALIYILTNAAVDFIQTLIDPRIQAS